MRKYSKCAVEGMECGKLFLSVEESKTKKSVTAASEVFWYAFRVNFLMGKGDQSNVYIFLYYLFVTQNKNEYNQDKNQTSRQARSVVMK